ncbi:hypothetical protein [Pontibacillus salicampi]
MAMVLNVIFLLSTLALTKFSMSSLLLKIYYTIALVMSVVGIVFMIVMSGWVAYTGGIIAAGVSFLGLLGIVFILLK